MAVTKRKRRADLDEEEEAGEEEFHDDGVRLSSRPAKIDVEAIRKRSREQRWTPLNWPVRSPNPVDFVEWGRIQNRAVDSVFEAMARGVKSAVGVGVTGFGKTRVAERIVQRMYQAGKRVIFFTHRQMLAEQTHQRFLEAGIPHGMRAAQFADLWDDDAPVQIAMVPSERSRKKHEERFQTDMAIWDEHHANSKGYAKELWDWYAEADTFQLGLTATPVNLGHVEEMLSFGTPPEMRKVGAIVPAYFVAPTEIDMADVRRLITHEFHSGDMAKLVMRLQVVGDIAKHFKILNPQMRPALGFAPNVAACLWLVDEAWKAGIPACSIDGMRVYFGERDKDGEPIVYRGSEPRRIAKTLSEEGTITLVWNRMVFAMGVDWPHLEHLVYAVRIGTVPGWLQYCGRGLRSYPGKSQCLIQDHAGNYHNLPSPNQSVDWTLGCTATSIAEAGLDASPAAKPQRCNTCGSVARSSVLDANGGKCLKCQKPVVKDRVLVYQTDGTLKEVGDSEVVHKRSALQEAQRDWDAMFWAARKVSKLAGQQFVSLKARFKAKHGDRFIIYAGKKNAAGKMCLWDKDGGGQAYLRNCPAPNAPEWNQPVCQVPFAKLQGASK